MKYQLKYKKGNIIKLADEGNFDLLINCCDCFGSFNTDISKEIIKRWPESKIIDQRTKKGDVHKLGSYSIASVMTRSGSSLLIINMYSAYKPSNDFKLIHLEQGLLRLQEIMRANVSMVISDDICKEEDWSDVESSLQKNFTKLDLTIVINK